MIIANRVRSTWVREVYELIALSEHSRQKFIQGRLPGDKFLVKPNFVEDRGKAASLPSASGTVLYAGRLSEEKGVKVLISAWAHGRLGRRAKLLIVGDGAAWRGGPAFRAPKLRSGL